MAATVDLVGAIPLLAEKYLGLPNADGAIDERVRSNVEGIYSQTDDCIFFSRILADDLVAYGKKLRRRYAWRFRLGTPKFSSADWSEAKQAGLIPPDDQYKNWLKASKSARPISCGFGVGCISFSHRQFKDDSENWLSPTKDYVCGVFSGASL